MHAALRLQCQEVGQGATTSRNFESLKVHCGLHGARDCALVLRLQECRTQGQRNPGCLAARVRDDVLRADGMLDVHWLPYACAPVDEG